MELELTKKTYSLIHWASENRDPISVWTKMNKFMSQFGDEYVFKYSDGIGLDVSYKGLTEIYRAKREESDEPKQAMKKSAWSKNLLWLSLSTGVISQFANSSVNLPEVLQFQLDLAHLVPPTNVFTFSQLQAFFKVGVILFDPFYSGLKKFGEINYSQSAYREIRRQIDTFKVPVAIEWFNYFSPSWVKRFGGDEFVMSAPVLHAEKVKETGGITLILQEEPFDYLNSEHVKKRKLVENYLGLPTLHEQYKA